MSYDAAVTKLEDAIYNLITDVTGLPIIFRNASNQKLTTQYIELYFKQFDEVGWEAEDEFDANFNRLTSKEYEVFVDISCHRGTNTSRVLQTILHSFSTQSEPYYKYFDETIGYLRVSPITRIDIPIDATQWEERSTMTVVFNMMVSVSDIQPVGYVETVEISSLKVKNGESNIILDSSETITYP